MPDELAVCGGPPVREDPFITGSDPMSRDIIGQAEKEAANRVLDSQRLSGFVAAPYENFYGGPEVQALEEACTKLFEVDYAVAVNSWTSGLIASIGALDLPPGSEIIVPPITMSATVAGLLHNDCIPVFADLDPNTGNLDPGSVRDAITDDTKAIVVVHLFGYPAAMDKLTTIADEYNLQIVEDAAQAPLAMCDGNYVGTIGDIGGISLNVYKHVQTGEGGVILTDNKELAQRTQLIRNHAETVVADLEGTPLGELEFDYSGLLGQNYRMTELTAAVGREQIRRLPEQVSRVQNHAKLLRNLLSDVQIVTVPRVEPNRTHSYYLFPMMFNESAFNGDLDTFLEVMQAEGIPVGRYVQPVYTLPLFEEGTVHDNGQIYGGNVPNASPVSFGPCPTAERLHRHNLFITDAVMPGMTPEDVQDIYRAIAKVEHHLETN